MMKKKLFDMFAELFGDSEGARFYFSPGRVNLIGEHTDYNGGHVFPCALTLGTYGAARKREDNKIHLYSMNLDSFGVVEASLDDLTNKKEYNWANYPLGIVCLEFFRSKIAKCLNVKFALKCFQCSSTFVSSVVISRINKTMLYFTVCDYNLGTIKNARCIFVA